MRNQSLSATTLQRTPGLVHRAVPEVSVLMQRLSIQSCALSRRAVETQIDGHLDLVAAIVARPDMTDFVVAHVCRRRWRDQ
jgi:hypothetical protein